MNILPILAFPKLFLMSHYTLTNLEHYFAAYRESVEQPEAFWEAIAAENFVWRKKWDTVLRWEPAKPEVKWFENARLNITENCIDRHLKNQPHKTAIIWEPNDPKEPALHISYKILYENVCRFANVLKDSGIKKGDRVCLYLPMIPELAYAVLACARIGAVHSVVFGGFSATALATRINDSGCKLLITSDGAYRGEKIIYLKEIADEALKNCPLVQTVLVAARTHTEVPMKAGRDYWLQPMMAKAVAECAPEIVDAEDPLFILYTSGSTGKPKGMLHSTAGYMVYTAYTFHTIFQCGMGDVYWCTADIGWITGHSYVLYGPLANGATTLLFEGVPSYPDYGRFWEVIEKHQVNQFYTAPTAIRSLAKEDISFVERYNLSSLKIIGSVGEPINEEAWHWYNNHIGKKRCPITDTWWQTETGGIMIAPIPFITPTKPTYATLPLPGVQPVLVDENGNEIEGNQAEGKLCIRFPWPAMARSIWGDHDRYKETYFSQFPGMYTTGDGALRDEVGYYRITGRIDDIIIVSGHNLGTAPIEDAINEHPQVAESAIVGFPHPIKGNALYGFIVLKEVETKTGANELRKEINQHITDHIGAIAKLDAIQFVPGLPKTRSGKIMRRILRKIAAKDAEDLGDISTLLDPEVVKEIKEHAWI